MCQHIYDTGRSAKWDVCPREWVPGLHYAVPNVTLGTLTVRPLTGASLEVLWEGHAVTCGVLWYAWGWGQVAGAFDGMPLTGPTKSGGGHDWFTLIPGRPQRLTHPVVAPTAGALYHITVVVFQRDGRQPVPDAAECPALAGVADPAQCERAARGVTAPQYVRATAIYDDTLPACVPAFEGALCAAVMLMVPPPGHPATYHPAHLPELLVTWRPFEEPQTGIAEYRLTISDLPVYTVPAFHAARCAPACPTLPVVAGVPLPLPVPNGTLLDVAVNATNGNRLTAGGRAAAFVLDSSPPWPIPPPQLLMQPQVDVVSLVSLPGTVPL